jgi:hypothetical protein
MLHSGSAFGGTAPKRLRRASTELTISPDILVIDLA